MNPTRVAGKTAATQLEKTKDNCRVKCARRPQYYAIYHVLVVLLLANVLPIMELPNGANLMRPQAAASIHLTASAFSVGRFGWPGLEWREIIDWWTSGYSRGVVIGRNYIPPCKLCDMPRMFRVD